MFFAIVHYPRLPGQRTISKKKHSPAHLARGSVVFGAEASAASVTSVVRAGHVAATSMATVIVSAVPETAVMAAIMRRWRRRRRWVMRSGMSAVAGREVRWRGRRRMMRPMMAVIAVGETAKNATDDAADDRAGGSTPVGRYRGFCRGPGVVAGRLGKSGGEGEGCGQPDRYHAFHIDAYTSKCSLSEFQKSPESRIGVSARPMPMSLLSCESLM